MAIEVNKKLDINEPSQIQAGEQIPVWDLRPGPEFGHKEGRTGRQLARMNHLISVGALENGIAEGKITRIFYNPNTRKNEERIVFACEPIPKKEMVPDSQELLSGVVTPLIPENHPEWIRIQTNKRRIV